MQSPPYAHPDQAAQRAAVDHNFVNHPPSTPEVGKRLDYLTGLFQQLGYELVAELPDSREKSVALTKLEECSMWSKAAVARNQ